MWVCLRSHSDIAKHVAGSVCYYTSHKGEERKLIDAEADHKTDHYRNLGRYVLESEDEETDRILGVKDEPDDPKIKDYQVLYESPKCVKDKKKYSSGEWLIGKKPIEYEET
jgi:hypothetical protein